MFVDVGGGAGTDISEDKKSDQIFLTAFLTNLTKMLDFFYTPCDFQF